MYKGKIYAVIRVFIVAVLLILQLVILAVAVRFLRQYFAFIYTLLEIVSMIVIIGLINEHDSQVYKFSWAIIVAILPVTGLIMYFLWGRNNKNRKLNSAKKNVKTRLNKYSRRDENIIQMLGEKNPICKRFSVYLDNEGFPPYSDTDTMYFPLGEYKFKALINDLKNARKFIFLEYFIVFEGKIWSEIFEIIKRKASEGVEVRFMYDDAGSLVTTSKDFLSELKSSGIKFLIFGPMHRYVDRLYFNYRNHQKIAVIDGNIGYTGGINIADEYANLYEKHGHWKDTAIRLEGEGVWGLTGIFLEMWEFSGGFVTEDYSVYYPTQKGNSKGFVQPFSDGPTNNPHNPAETLYTQIIANAGEYVYITTPYLIIDDSLLKTLSTAAQSGVDVRVITPKIFDHWYTKVMTHAYYESLLKEGVRIFEYTPGFMHSKTIISDDCNAIVGSINLDYRSFYLHYECGVWICGTDTVKDIKEDYNKIFKASEEIFYEGWKKRSWLNKAFEMLLRIFAPIM